MLTHIVEPDYGIITNVGKAHLEGFGSFEGVIRTKGELYDYLRSRKNSSVFIQNENPYLNQIAEGLNCIRYGQTEGLYVSGHVLKCSPFLAFAWIGEKGLHEVQTHLIGTYNLDNVLVAPLLLAVSLGWKKRKLVWLCHLIYRKITALNWKKPQIII